MFIADAERQAEEGSPCSRCSARSRATRGRFGRAGRCLVCGAPPHTPPGEIISPEPPCFVRSGCRKEGGKRAVVFGLQRIRHSRLRPLPSTLRQHSPHPVPGRLHRIGARPLLPPRPQRLPLRAFCVPQVPVSCLSPSSSRSSVARAPLFPRSRNRGALRPAFPQAPSALPASFLPPSLRSLSPERPHSPPRRRSSLTPRAPFATRSPLSPPHALIPAFSGLPHRARPPLPQFSPSLPLSLPRRYFFFALFANVEFFIDL